MSVFTHPEFHHHEQVLFGHDQASGLKAIIAIHDTRRGPALGGCRMFPYASERDAITDVLRLSRGMTYKAAMADLPLGGGKSVIIGDPRRDKHPALLRAMGRLVESLGGRYIIAEDSGTGVEDMKIMAEVTDHISGVQDKSTDGGMRSGDPSPTTAYGTFVGIQAAVRHKLGRDSLEGLRVAIQGMGHVGYYLARLLKDAGAHLWVTDIHREPLDRAVEEFGAIAVSPEGIFGLEVEVFAPCALGAVLNDETIPQLHAPIVAGAANNQLAEDRHGDVLRSRSILYAPDYVINAGGLIDVYYERAGFDRARMMAHVERIGATLSEIFRQAERDDLPTNVIADRIAEERLAAAG
ncbi:MAG TPA: Glu/Leu/Phe/Val dehydrogenase [Candidatus Competibacteraceae bacterium]|nr:Glu/Leu/Phe/Val dehydrogenase [Candidatus Competibacteraceae bacterium]